MKTKVFDLKIWSNAVILGYEDFWMQLCFAVLLDASCPSLSISVRPQPLSGWARSAVDGGDGARRGRKPHAAVWAEQHWNGAKMGPGNEASASFALQLSATGLFRGFTSTLVMIVHGRIDAMHDSILCCLIHCPMVWCGYCKVLRLFIYQERGWITVGCGCILK